MYQLERLGHFRCPVAADGVKVGAKVLPIASAEEFRAESTRQVN